jgi:hypothetical protein
MTRFDTFTAFACGSLIGTAALAFVLGPNRMALVFCLGMLLGFAIAMILGDWLRGRSAR